MKCQCSPDCDLDITTDRVLCLECFAIVHPDHYEKHLETHKIVNVYDRVKNVSYQVVKISHQQEGS